MSSAPANIAPVTAVHTRTIPPGLGNLARSVRAAQYEHKVTAVLVSENAVLAVESLDDYAEVYVNAHLGRGPGRRDLEHTDQL